MHSKLYRVLFFARKSGGLIFFYHDSLLCFLFFFFSPPTRMEGLDEARSLNESWGVCVGKRRAAKMKFLLCVLLTFFFWFSTCVLVSLQEETYDVIVLGTGLTECILSGVLSVDGKKVSLPRLFHFFFFFLG